MTESHNRLAVVVATRNGERFLADQLRSILSQSRTPDEVIVSDDASEDHTIAIAQRVLGKECAKHGIAVRFLTNNPPLGIAENFRQAILHSSADLVALADQDDLWYPNKLETLATRLKNQPEVLMVHSDARLVDDNAQPLGMTVLASLRLTPGERKNLVSGRGIRAVVRRNLVTGQTSLVRRKLVEWAGPIPEGWLHDEWWALLAASQDGLLLDPGVYGDYRQHDSNQVGATRSGLQRLIERFREPQDDFRSRHRTRHIGLEAFLARADAVRSPAARTLLEGRIAHYRAQARLPASRWRRILPIFTALIRGDYHRYRRGLFDALRDLFQPGSSG